MDMVVTRFAPSPTGTLHIGSVRTILFNWLFARANNGKFLLRIEDTDKERSKKEFVENILTTLKDLGLNYDEELVFQSEREERHREVAYDLLRQGKAYKCYCTQQDLEAERERARIAGNTPRYNRKCRDLEKELSLPYTIRLKTDLTGELCFTDLIQGACSVKNEHMDDMILLRSDGTPTYMHAVVVDDHDMGITHVIRGTEHLNNAYRQLQIYKACGISPPEFAHVSLIHAENGSKLSKRTGAKSVEDYQKEGFLKEAILNYLLRLGWSYGEDEIISLEDCCKIFDIKDVRSSAARFSLDKLLNVNSIYLRSYSNRDLIEKLKQFDSADRYSEDGWNRVLLGMDGLKSRSRTLQELLLMADIYGKGEEFFEKLSNIGGCENKYLVALADKCNVSNWSGDSETWFRTFLSEQDLKLKNFAPILRFVLTKSKVSPGLFDILNTLGPNLVQARLKNALK